MRIFKQPTSLGRSEQAKETPPRWHDILRTMLRSVLAKSRRQQSIAALEALPDSVLRDIGIRRDQLPILTMSAEVGARTEPPQVERSAATTGTPKRVFDVAPQSNRS